MSFLPGQSFGFARVFGLERKLDGLRRSGPHLEIAWRGNTLFVHSGSLLLYGFDGLAPKATTKESMMMSSVSWSNGIS